MTFSDVSAVMAASAVPAAAGSPFQVADVVEAALPEDERLWVPMADGVWVRPLLFDTSHGAWVNVMRTKTSGIISRHRHPSPVHAYVIAGRWQYAEHDWVAEAGKYVLEPAGDTHTLIVSDTGEYGYTLFWISGCMVHVDEHGAQVGYSDVFTRLAEADAHYRAVGVASDYIRSLVR